jgi:hypothetical protein
MGHTKKKKMSPNLNFVKKRYKGCVFYRGSAYSHNYVKHEHLPMGAFYLLIANFPVTLNIGGAKELVVFL